MIPGAGTDGGTFYLAEQLNHTNAEILYIDFSSMSKQIAQTRARMRSLSNILWIKDWLESVPFLGINRFDLVICSGVLHHLKSPSQGLQILNSAQLHTGGAILMVYAQYGRTGIYHIQKILRKINDGGRIVSKEIRNANALLKILPITNWYFKRKGVDDINIEDIELYDRLLHERDICYNVVDLHDVVDTGGYNLVAHDSPESRIAMLLKPSVFLEDKVPALFKKSFIIKQLVGEIFNGMVEQHSIYISKNTKSEAIWNRKGNAIFANG